MLQDSEGTNLWEMTWNRAYGVSSGLTPSILAASGVHVKTESPVAQPPSSSQTDQTLEAPAGQPGISHEGAVQPEATSAELAGRAMESHVASPSSTRTPTELPLTGEGPDPRIPEEGSQEAQLFESPPAVSPEESTGNSQECGAAIW